MQITRSPGRRPSFRHDAGRAAVRARVTLCAVALLLGASATRAGAATTLRTAPLFAVDGDSLLCSAVNWDTKPRAISVRIVFVAGGGGEVASASCDPTVPLASCIAAENVSVPIVSSGIFACEVRADGPKSKFRAVLENVTTGRSVEAR